MENTAGKASKRKAKSIGILTKREAPTAIMGVIAFFLGRVALFQFMNPLALGFLSRFVDEEYRFYVIAACTAIGILTKFEGLYMLKYLAAIAVVLGARMFLNMAGVKMKGAVTGLVTAFATLFCGLLYAYFYGKSSYFVAMAVVEAALVWGLNIVLKQGVGLFYGETDSTYMDNETLISVAIILGALVAGASDIYFGPVSLKYMLSTYIVLVAANKGGAAIGSLCGVLLGLILTLTGFSNYALVGVLSMAAVTAGVLKQGGKFAVLGGFVAGGLLSAVYLDVSILGLGLLYSVICGSVLYFVTPDRFSFNINTMLVNDSKTAAYQAKELAQQKLYSLAQTFNKMGTTLSGLAEKKQALTQRDISRLIDDAASKACGECEHKDSCWEQNFYKTYQMSFALLEICEQNGSINPMDIPEEYCQVCAYVGHYAGWLSRLFDMYKLNLNWQNQISESRELVSQQLTGVSQIIEDVAKELEIEANFNGELEEKIAVNLLNAGIEAQNIIVLENPNSKLEITMNRRPCNGKNACMKEMAAIITNSVGRKMSSQNKRCETQGSKCNLKFVEEQKFQVVSSSSVAKKGESSQSGDSHTVMEIRGGQCIMALSDGMGSGRKARAESEAALDLLEEFLEAGFSKEIAIKMINSVLVLKSGDDSFSTMDICAIDMHTGIAEFVKIGAAATFVKRGHIVSEINSQSLPMGILSEVEIQSSKKKLKDGDVIVMVTDGVADAVDNAYGTSWIVEALSTYDGANPKDVADYLIKEAVKHTGGEVRDDMTVLAARMWEKIYESQRY